MKRPPFLSDERERIVLYRIAFIMYIITLLAIMASLLYRQFWLKQDLSQFEDIAIISTFNSIVFIAALLYKWGIGFKKMKVVNAILIYLGFVAAGAAFTILKYFVFLDQPLSASQLFNKLYIIAAILAILLFVYYIFGYFGHKKIEKEIEE